MNTTVISAADSDTFLAQFTSWTALDDEVKEFYIARACVYAQTKYTCADVVWEDDPDTDDVEVVSIPDEVKEAIAYFAYADSQSNLFGNPAVVDETKGKLRSHKEQLGDLLEEKSWYRGGETSPSGVARSLGYPHTLMSVHCTLNSSSVTLVRV
jgi:hypothetical protein